MAEAPKTWLERAMESEATVTINYVSADSFAHRAERTCRYEACPNCDWCGVCGEPHGNFVAGCGDNCPYRRYHRIRDWFRRKKEQAR